MSNVLIQYAVVLTSCGRFDLLRRTVESLLQFADVRPAQCIIVEDSGDETVRDVLADIDYPFEIVVNRQRLGQNAAIDVGYVRVNTPFVFHCEDDWLFFRTGFVMESHALLQKFPKVSAVMLRGRDTVYKNRAARYEELNGIMFFRSLINGDEITEGIGYNPGLRRMSDYQRIAPIADIGGEGEVDTVFRRIGFYTAYLEIPAVVHLGWSTRTQKKHRPKIFTHAYISYKVEKIMGRRRQRKQFERWWQLHGLRLQQIGDNDKS